MGFHHVALLPFRACFSIIFLKNCGSGEHLGTTTCLRTVVGHAPCKMLSLILSLFLCQLHFMEIIGQLRR